MIRHINASTGEYLPPIRYNRKRHVRSVYTSKKYAQAKAMERDGLMSVAVLLVVLVCVGLW